MSFSNLPEPPTLTSLVQARNLLATREHSVRELADRIHAAEEELARIVRVSESQIQQLTRERAQLEHELILARAYVSPVKRLPQELLRHIFLMNFEDYPCCAWVLAAVSSLWRRLVLSMPMMWSKIRLVTTQASSADTIRLWLERAGPTVPLDIEIFLRSQSSSQANEPPSRRRSLPLTPPYSSAFGEWFAQGGLHGPALMHVHHAGTIQLVSVPAPAQAHTHNELWGAASPERPTVQPQPNASASGASAAKQKNNVHWGHIAFFYLVEQIHRWERFVFRFDKQFASISALKSIEGNAPLLREFEVSGGESAFFGDWKWMPCAPATQTLDLPKLTSLTLQYMPFKWSSPMIRNLKTLSLRTLPTSHIQLDRILYMIALNSGLETLALHVASAHPPVLSLNPTTLHSLKSLSIGGHYLLGSLLESLTLPALETLALDIEPREPLEDMLSNLLLRSGGPVVTRLSIAYAYSLSNAGFYYGTGAGVGSWGFLADFEHVQVLQVGSTPLEPLLAALSAPDDEHSGQQDRWVCPALVALALRGCHAHGDGVAKLVHVIEARNPDAAATGAVVAGVAPVRLKQLEMHDCATLGLDVVAWLKARVDEVAFTDPLYEGSPRSPGFI